MSQFILAANKCDSSPIFLQPSPINTMSTYVDFNVRLPHQTQDPFTTERYRQFAAHLPKNCEKVLDVGSNDGRGGIALKEVAPHVSLFGLDCVPEWARNLPACYDGVLECMTTDIQSEDRQYDAVVAGEFLEHLYPRDVEPTLMEFQRVLKIGGRLLMTTPNPGALKMKLKRDTVLDRSHLTQHHPNSLRMRLRMHGFSRIRIYGSGRAIRYVGSHFPCLAVYGSYLVIADKW